MENYPMKINVVIEYFQYKGDSENKIDAIADFADSNVRLNVLTWAGWVPLLENDYVIKVGDVLDVWSCNRFEHLISAKERRSIE